jgi:hypothetical protein
MDDVLRLTQAAYAKARELSRQRVHQLVKDGRVPLDQDGLVNVVQADLNLAALLDQRKANRSRQIGLVEAANEPGKSDELPLQPKDSAPLAAPESRAASPNAAKDYWEHKSRREKIEGDRADLALRKALGEVVDADVVAHSRFDTAQKVASALLQIPARIAPVIAPNDPQRAELLMTEEVKRVLNELAGDLDQPGPGSDAERREARAA